MEVLYAANGITALCWATRGKNVKNEFLLKKRKKRLLHLLSADCTAMARSVAGLLHREQYGLRADEPRTSLESWLKLHQLQLQVQQEFVQCLIQRWTAAKN